MKLLLFIRSLAAGGAERVCVTIANEMARRGYDVCIATTISLPVAYEIENSVRLIDVFQGKPPSQNKIKIAWSLFRNIRTITKVETPSVVVSFLSGMNKYVITALYGSRYPVIACEHTTFNKPSQRHSLSNYIIRWQINKLACRVTILTKYDKQYVGDRLKNLVVMPNPLSFPALSKETFLQHDDERKNILVCGSLDRHINKGFDDMIANFHQIAYKYPDCDLDILGGGSEESIEHLKGIIKEHDMEERIHLLGYSKRVDEEMLRHKYFVLCSKTEGLPMALMEAMAMGCACISFNCISGPDEIINDGEDGILVKDQDFNELNKKLGWLIENDDRRNEMARRAIQNIQRFSLQNIGDRWECLIKEV